MADMDTEAEWTRLRGVVEQHMKAMTTELIDLNLCPGYWPDDSDAAMVDCCMAVLRHQKRIDNYHKEQQTTFTNT